MIDLPLNVLRNPPTERRRKTRCGEMTCCSIFCCTHEKGMPNNGGMRLSAENDPDRPKKREKEKEKNKRIDVNKWRKHERRENKLNNENNDQTHSMDFCLVCVFCHSFDLLMYLICDLLNIFHCSTHIHDEMLVDNLIKTKFHDRDHQSRIIYKCTDILDIEFPTKLLYKLDKVLDSKIDVQLVDDL